MATYPASLDTFVNPSASDSLAVVPHHSQHGNANDAIEALETKLGIGSSTPVQGRVLSSPADGSSAWQVPASVSVLDFGATGDGTTDDTVALQAALDAAIGGGTVLVPAGTYRTSDTLWVPEDVTFQGQGGATIKLLDGISSTASVVGADGDRVTIRDLTIDGNKANLATLTPNDSCFLVMGWTANDVTIEGCVLKDSTGHGVYFTDATGMRIIDNRISGCNLMSIYLVPPAQSNVRGVIADNIITGIGSHAIALGHAGECVVRGNGITGIRTSGLTVDVSGTAVTATVGDFDDLIPGNFLLFDGGVERQIASITDSTHLVLGSSGGTLSGVDAVGGSGDLIGTCGSRNILEGNILRYGASLGFSLYSDAAGTERAYGNSVRGNQVSNIAGSGISLQEGAADIQGLLGTSLVGNVLQDCGDGVGAMNAGTRSGIFIAGTHVYRTLIADNTIYSTSGDTDYWLYLGGVAAGETRVGRNVVDGMGNAGIYGGLSFSLGADWGSGAATSNVVCNGASYAFRVTSGNSGCGASPGITVTTYVVGPEDQSIPICVNVNSSGGVDFVLSYGGGAQPVTSHTFIWNNTPGTGTTYDFAVQG